MPSADLEYVGFWPRVGASIVDSILLLIVISPIIRMIYGPAPEVDISALMGGGGDPMALLQGAHFFRGPADVIINLVLPAVAICAFWIARGATPGKMLIGARVVDAKTGNKPDTRQSIVRYLGYYVSTIPLLLGLFWVGIDARKQGWHDKLAGTVVVRSKTKRVQFEASDEPDNRQ